MDAMDEFQEADILWPDTAKDELAPCAPMDTEELYEAAGSASSVVVVAPVFGRRFEGLFPSGAGCPSLSADADDDEAEWQEADVLWPDTAADPPRGSGGLMMWPFPGSSCSGRAGRCVKPAGAARRDGWTTGPAASSPINIPARCQFRTAMNRRRW